MSIYIVAIILGLILGHDGFKKIKTAINRNFRRRKTYRDVFDHCYLESKAFYMYLFQKAPSIILLTEVDTGKALTHIEITLAEKIRNIYQKSTIDRSTESGKFHKTFVELKNKVLIELGSDFVEA